MGPDTRSGTYLDADVSDNSRGVNVSTNLSVDRYTGGHVQVRFDSNDLRSPFL